MGQSAKQVLQLDTINSFSSRGYTTYDVSDGTSVQMDSFAEAASTGDYMYYNWHSVPGYSDFGTYMANGAGSGTLTFNGPFFTQDSDQRL